MICVVFTQVGPVYTLSKGDITGDADVLDYDMHKIKIGDICLITGLNIKRQVTKKKLIDPNKLWVFAISADT